MLPLPAHFAGLILAFAPLFVQRSWRHAHLLLVGAILTPGRRTVTSVLRIMGRAQERRFVNVHRILNRAAWCPRSGSRILLGLGSRTTPAILKIRAPRVALSTALALTRFSRCGAVDHQPSARTGSGVPCLTTQTVADTIKRYAKAAGLDASTFGAHSLSLATSWKPQPCCGSVTGHGSERAPRPEIRRSAPLRVLRIR